MKQNQKVFRCVLVDDEEMAIKNLKMALTGYPDIHIIGEAQTKEKALGLIELLKPDVVFLDINLLSATGFDLLDELEYRDFHVVFVTAHNEFAVKAFEYSAFNYLLKPIQTDKLDTVVEDLRNSTQTGLDEHTLQHLFSLMEKPEDVPQTAKMTLPTPQGVVLRSIEDILYFRSAGNSSYVYFKDGNRLLVSKSLKDMEEQFIPYDFFRTHHSMVINCGLIAEYRQKNGELTLEDGSMHTVSFRRRANFMRHLKQTLSA